ncbi:HepT-like ribonuclease domain-containing protein [Gloeocapsa sp. BRSZ]
MLSLALVRLIEIIGEAANKVSPACQNTYYRIPWREIIGMRNRVIHAYFDVDMSIIWQVVKEELPKLIEEVNQAIQDLE